MSRPQNSFWTLPGLQKKTNKQPRSKTKVVIEESKEDKTFSTLWVDPKLFLKLPPGKKKSHTGPQRAKIKSNQKSKLKEI